MRWNARRRGGGAGAAALAGRHDQLGLEIDPWTAAPEWEGDRVDTDWALFTLR